MNGAAGADGLSLVNTVRGLALTDLQPYLEPSLELYGITLSSGTLAPVAVTFSADFEPEAPGWHILRLDVIGQAALYLDGVQRFKIEGASRLRQTRGAQLYLSKRPHELIVRYMSDQPVRQLGGWVALRDGVPTPLQAGLSRGACP